MNKLKYALKKRLVGWQVAIKSGELKGYKFGLLTGSRFVKGTYCQDETATLKSLISEGDVVLDVGAHVGYFTLLASKLVGNSGHVYAFEPHPMNLDYLNAHMKNNSIKNVSVIDSAVGEHISTLWFDLAKGTGRGQLLASQNNPETNVKVAVNTLDSLLASGKIQGADFIKMDIEGAEVGALKSATTLLSQHKPTILMSTHGESIKQDCENILLELGYELEPVNDRDFIARHPTHVR